VERVAYDPKAPDRVVISFERGGHVDTARLDADHLQPGDAVTVLVDPDDSEQISLTGHRQQSPLVYGLTLFLLVTGVFVLLPVACVMVALVVRRRRHDRSRGASSLPSTVGTEPR
jgi:hypothetical protein